jgi:hypothetical protein
MTENQIIAAVILILMLSAVGAAVALNWGFWRK